MSREEINSREAPTKSPKTKPNGTGRNASADEMLEALAEQATQPAPSGGSSFVRALRDVVLVAALLAGGTYLYYNHVTKKEAVTKLAVAAADKMEKDDLASLKAAEAKYKEILALDSDNGIALSGLAETYFHQWRHGLDTKQLAEDAVRKAESEGAETPERYAAAAYLQIVSGQAAGAESTMKALLEKGYSHPKLAHALGWAQLEQGRYYDANETLRKALDFDFNAVRFALTLADSAHRSGDERGAARHLERVLGTAMNPTHELALPWMAALRIKNTGNLENPLKWITTTQEKGDAIGPVAKGLLVWAEGEALLALGKNKEALEKAEAAVAANKEYAPFHDFRARALAANGKSADAAQAYDAALAAKPSYRGIKWAFARMKSEKKDPSAMTLIDELEQTDPGTSKGPEYEIFRGDFLTKTGELEKAKAAYTRAAELGDDPDILFGLARITFLEEKKKGTKADIDKVAEEFGRALEARAIFPEVNEYVGEINLWNFQIEPANKSFLDAEGQYKKLRRPIPEILRFYDHVIELYAESKEKQIAKDAQKMAEEWRKKKADYLASIAAGTN